MARKSRKETAVVAVLEADAACRAAIYVRLSVEDTHTHSVSIETDRKSTRLNSSHPTTSRMPSSA